MNEILLGTIPVIGVGMTVLGAWLYMIGGREQGPGKWVRRFMASLAITVGVLLESICLGTFKLLSVLLYPILLLPLSLGYGASNIFVKILKRSLVVICFLLAGFLFVFLNGFSAMSFTILFLQGLIGLGSIILGVRNPIPAAAEEFFVCLFLSLCLNMYPFIGLLQ